MRNKLTLRLLCEDHRSQLSKQKAQLKENGERRKEESKDERWVIMHASRPSNAPRDASFSFPPPPSSCVTSKWVNVGFHKRGGQRNSQQAFQQVPQTLIYRSSSSLLSQPKEQPHLLPQSCIAGRRESSAAISARRRGRTDCDRTRVRSLGAHRTLSRVRTSSRGSRACTMLGKRSGGRDGAGQRKSPPQRGRL